MWRAVHFSSDLVSKPHITFLLHPVKLWMSISFGWMKFYRGDIILWIWHWIFSTEVDIFLHFFSVLKHFSNDLPADTENNWINLSLVLYEMFSYFQALCLFFFTMSRLLRALIFIIKSSHCGITVKYTPQIYLLTMQNLSLSHMISLQ